MTHSKGRKSIRTVAKNNCVSEAEVSKQMQEAIDAAWSSSNLDSLRLQRELFPDGKPSPEEFIEKMAQYVQQERAKKKHQFM